MFAGMKMLKCVELSLFSLKYRDMPRTRTVVIMSFMVHSSYLDFSLMSAKLRDRLTAMTFLPVKFYLFPSWRTFLSEG